MSTFDDFFSALRSQRRRSHECQPKPIAARPASPCHDEDVKAPGTLVLYRCDCGIMSSQWMPGVWTAQELGVPCGDTDAVEALTRVGGGR